MVGEFSETRSMALVDRIGFGCVSLTAHPTVGAALAALESAFDLGIRHFDTAPAYGRGYSEQILGRFLRTRRDQVMVATKLSPWGRMAQSPLPASLALPVNALRRRMRSSPPAESGPPGPLRSAGGAYLSRHEVEAQFEDSRRRLGVDRIDLYLLHEEVPAALHEDALDYLQSLKAEGRIGRLGLAANGDHYLSLSSADLADWDVLQYEAGRAWPGHSGLAERFPDKLHIAHSCLRDVPRDAASIGAALAAELAVRPTGRVLFASTKADHIRANILALTG